MRLIIFVFAAVVILLTATTSTATVTLTAISKNLTTGATPLFLGPQLVRLSTLPGDQIQIDIFMTNSGSAVVGANFSASVTSFAGSLQFDGGSTSAAWFHEFVGLKFGDPRKGLANRAGTSNGGDGSFTSVAIPRSLTSADIDFDGSVLFFNGFGGNLADQPRTGTGALDLGILDGATSPIGGTPNVDFTGSGAAHARLFFTLVGGAALLEIGTGSNQSSVIDVNAPDNLGTIVGTTILITSMPEPGTALLLGLGLSALSRTGQRRPSGSGSGRGVSIIGVWRL